MSRFFHFRRRNLESLKIAWQTSVFFRFCFLSSFFPWLLLVIIPFLRLRPTAEAGQFIPLHYNIYFGVDKFGPWFEIFELPLFGLLVWLINTWLAARFLPRFPALANFLSAIGLLLQFALLFAVYFTILLNM
jgi:hypothetical protein